MLYYICDEEEFWKFLVRYFMDKKKVRDAMWKVKDFLGTQIKSDITSSFQIILDYIKELEENKNDDEIKIYKK